MTASSHPSTCSPFPVVPTLPLDPQKAGTLFFIGIGGIGMSGLALALHQKGYSIQGSDTGNSPHLARLKEHGLRIFHTHSEAHVRDVSWVIFSSAITSRNPEILKARAMGIPVLHRSDVLAHLTQHTPTIAITGSHGKTTTTALIGKMLSSANLEPTVLTGGIMEDFQGPVLVGQGPWLVAEADESDGTHQKLAPHMAIVNNIDQEHMAFYHNEEKLFAGFAAFLNNVPKDGVRMASADCSRTAAVISSLEKPVLTYGLHPSAHTRVRVTASSVTGTLLHVTFPDKTTFEDVHLNLHGVHNAQNAAAALSVAFQLGLSEATIRQALSTFKGVKRRFSRLATVGDITVIDDYAHHPAEIAATLNTAKKLCGGNVIAVCEPHRYSRLKDLYGDFVDALRQADEVVLLPVYSAGESPMTSVSSRKLSTSLNAKGTTSSAWENHTRAHEYLKKRSSSGDMIVFMGAGTITNLAHALAADLSSALERKDPLP